MYACVHVCGLVSVYTCVYVCDLVYVGVCGLVYVYTCMHVCGLVSLQDAVDQYFSPVFVESECSQCQCRNAKLRHRAVSLPRSVLTSPLDVCRSFKTHQ